MKQAARFAHISDLHIGRSAENDANAVRLCASLMESGIDQVVATGDLTHRGLRRELEQFESIFAPLIAQGRMVVVPGNHVCLGDDVSRDLMEGQRVQTTTRPGLYIVRVNSTAPHNRSWIKVTAVSTTPTSTPSTPRWTRRRPASWSSSRSTTTCSRCQTSTWRSACRRGCVSSSPPSWRAGATS